MNIRNYSSLILGIAALLVLMGCGSKKGPDPTSFTKIDSLTDTYLALQDSMVDTWNMMIKDDNKKIRAMRGLIHELEIGGQYSKGDLKSYEQRVDQLTRIRYTPKTMWNTDVIEEYDFASSSLVTELIALAESYTAFSYNTTLQKLVEEIRAADQRVENYRADYDAVALQYNKFIEDNQETLKEIAESGTLDKKPLFQVAAE
ncbi:MAG TPA: LemA family protein [Cyclobacteriaceae bacterium]|nr:LemA family protein [Cyclobacteriaceae bacterium]